MWSRRPTRGAVLSAIVAAFVGLQCGRDQFDLLATEPEGMPEVTGGSISGGGSRPVGPSGGFGGGGEGGSASGGKASCPPCSKAAPYCGDNGFCVQCQRVDGKDQGCGGRAPYCGDYGFCVQCRTVGGQVEGCNPTAPYCYPGGFCGQCRTVGGEVQGCDPPLQPHCSDEGYCVQCRDLDDREVGCAPDYECQGYRCFRKCDPEAVPDPCENSVCSPIRRVCVECNTAQDCAGRLGRPFCEFNRCVECTANEHCLSRSCVSNSCIP